MRCEIIGGEIIVENGWGYRRRLVEDDEVLTFREGSCIIVVVLGG